MYELTVIVEFEAAHRIVDYPGKCDRLHGHNWSVEVTVEGEKLNSLGMLIDFKELKGEVNKVMDLLDHNYLNELPAFQKINPTAENIAKFIYEKMKEAECKDVAPGHMIITQKMSKDKVKVKIDGDTYTVDALALFGNSTGKDSPFAEGKKMEAQQVQMMKSMGVVMEMNVTMPGKVTKVDGKAYTGKEGPIKVDLMEVAATGKTSYMIESKGGSSLMTYLLIGGGVLAVLLIIGGVVLATRKKA